MKMQVLKYVRSGINLHFTNESCGHVLSVYGSGRFPSPEYIPYLTRQGGINRAFFDVLAMSSELLYKASMSKARKIT